MKRHPDLTRNVFFFTAIGLFANPAQAAQCEHFDQLRVYARSHFSEIKGPKLFEDHNDLASKWKLPNAQECIIDIIGPKFSRFRCSWLLVKGLENKSQAKSAYEAIINSVRACVAAPGEVERWNSKRSLGETAALLDPFAGMRKDQLRYIEVSYDYSDYWWVVRLEYEVDDDFKP